MSKPLLILLSPSPIPYDFRIFSDDPLLRLALLLPSEPAD